jgi:hypothetical protein
MPSIAVVMEGVERYRKTFSAAEWKAAVRAAFEAGAFAWIADFLEKRFTGYATAKLGYALRSGHVKRKKNYGVPQPLVWTGETMESVLSQATVRVSGSAANSTASIPMRVPGPRAPIVYEVLSTILDTEMGPTAREIERVLHGLIDQSTVTKITKSGKNKGKVRKRTFAGVSTRVDQRNATRTQRVRQQERFDAANARAEDRRVELSETLGARQEQVQQRLRRTHAQWRRQAGGAAPTGGPAAAYAASPRFRRAQAQSRYRQRISSRN